MGRLDDIADAVIGDGLGRSVREGNPVQPPPVVVGVLPGPVQGIRHGLQASHGGVGKVPGLAVQVRDPADPAQDIPFVAGPADFRKGDACQATRRIVGVAGLAVETVGDPRHLAHVVAGQDHAASGGVRDGRQIAQPVAFVAGLAVQGGLGQRGQPFTVMDGLPDGIAAGDAVLPSIGVVAVSRCQRVRVCDGCQPPPVVEGQGGDLAQFVRDLPDSIHVVVGVGGHVVQVILGLREMAVGVVNVGGGVVVFVRDKDDLVVGVVGDLEKRAVGMGHFDRSFVVIVIIAGGSRVGVLRRGQGAVVIVGEGLHAPQGVRRRQDLPPGVVGK